MRDQCKTCRQFVRVRLGWAGNRSQHVKATCPLCGAFIKFVPQTEAVLALVGPKRAKEGMADLFQDTGGEGG